MEVDISSGPAAARALIERINYENSLGQTAEDSRIASFIRQSLKLYGCHMPLACDMLNP
jgi:hypothetical protein